MKYNRIPKLVELRRDIEVITSAFDSFNEHRHEFCEFEYILEGDGEYVLNGQVFHIEKGDLLYVTPTDLHSYCKGKGKYRTITVQFSPWHLSYQLNNISKIDSCVITCDKKMTEAFYNILEEKRENEYDSFAMKNCLERILILFLRSNSIETQRDGSYDIGQIIGYINQNFRAPLTLDMVSAKCGYSNAHFCRQFRKITDMTFVEYLNSVRASHVKNLLLTENMTITDICFDCGFGSVRSLNRAFLKKYGCSPMEYKKNNAVKTK